MWLYATHSTNHIEMTAINSRWVSLKTIGGWFNTTPEVKEALAINKEKHKQVSLERSISSLPYQCIESSPISHCH